MAHFIIGTAGHIDHGKTSFVKALTGKNTDTLKEEQERNITIDIGFAFLGDEITIIDVPGHEKFIKNMVAGVSTIDFVVFLIAADDGVMPQTKEHLDILNLLEIKDGIIVVSKIDKVEEEWLELVKEDIKDKVEGTFLDGKEIFEVDSISGKGIDDVKNEILKRKTIKDDKYKDFAEKQILRLPVDRVFSVKGYGTVITGTVLSGTISEGDEIVVQPRQITTKVRGLECHGSKVTSLATGYRAAVNLQGIKETELERGDILTSTGYLTPTFMFDARLYLLKSWAKLENHTRVRLHAGTKEVFARITLIDTEKLEGGNNCLVQLRLEEEISIVPDERFVLRSYSPQITIGGGKVIRISEKKSKRFDENVIQVLKDLEKGSDDEVISETIKLSGKTPLTIAQVAEKTGKHVSYIRDILQDERTNKKVITIGNFYLHKEIAELVKKSIIKYLENYHKDNPHKIGMPKADIKTKIYKNFNQQVFDYLLKELLEENQIDVEGNFVKIKNYSISISDKLQAKIDKVKTNFIKIGFKQSEIKDIAKELSISESEFRDIMGIMISQKSIIKIADTLYLETSLFEKAKELIISELNKKEKLKIGDISQLLDSSRKFVVPLMEYFDSIGLTERSDDYRILKN